MALSYNFHYYYYFKVMANRQPFSRFYCFKIGVEHGDTSSVQGCSSNNGNESEKERTKED